MRRVSFSNALGNLHVEATGLSSLNGESNQTQTLTLTSGLIFTIFNLSHSNLYWTDWNREAPKIETSSLEGENRRILVNKDIGLPNGLTFDPFSKLLCWADAGITGGRQTQSSSLPWVPALYHRFYKTKSHHVELLNF